MDSPMNVSISNGETSFTIGSPVLAKPVGRVVLDSPSEGCSSVNGALTQTPVHEERGKWRQKRPTAPEDMDDSPMNFGRETKMSRPAGRLLAPDPSKIMQAIQKQYEEPNLIGDSTKVHALPLINGKHQDLKSIHPSTLASLIEGQFHENVSEFTIVDCRYPYEYEGGHIQGAINIFTKDSIVETFFNENTPSNEAESKRHIIIFHCEFSSERGPTMLRHLRKEDRSRNPYPRLTHPEIYILNGGYKAFFESNPKLCTPENYVKMSENKDACRRFRAKSKSWDCELKSTGHYTRSSLFTTI